jgi:hypothetical protein
MGHDPQCGRWIRAYREPRAAAVAGSGGPTSTGVPGEVGIAGGAAGDPARGRRVTRRRPT